MHPKATSKSILQLKITLKYDYRSNCHVCELLLTSFSTSNSPNRLLVQMPFNAAKQSVLGHVLPSLLVWDRNWARFVECIHVALFTIFSTLFSNRNSLSQSASSRSHTSHTTSRVTCISCPTFIRYSASSRVSIYSKALFCYQDFNWLVI